MFVEAEVAFYCSCYYHRVVECLTYPLAHGLLIIKYDSASQKVWYVAELTSLFVLLTCLEK